MLVLMRLLFRKTNWMQRIYSPRKSKYYIDMIHLHPFLCRMNQCIRLLFFGGDANNLVRIGSPALGTCEKSLASWEECEGDFRETSRIFEHSGLLDF